MLSSDLMILEKFFPQEIQLKNICPPLFGKLSALECPGGQIDRFATSTRNGTASLLNVGAAPCRPERSAFRHYVARPAPPRFAPLAGDLQSGGNPGNAATAIGRLVAPASRAGPNCHGTAFAARKVLRVGLRLPFRGSRPSRGRGGAGRVAASPRARPCGAAALPWAAAPTGLRLTPRRGRGALG
jgi:hypothetical protein